jgi:hypothetical protein
VLFLSSEFGGFVYLVRMSLLFYFLSRERTGKEGKFQNVDESVVKFQ